MNQHERQLIDELFDRLARLEGNPRDPEATAAIAEGMRRAPNATYALVQTVLVQDEALRQAEARIQELEQAATPSSRQEQSGFLDSMRDNLFGQGGGRGSVPRVPPPLPPGAGAAPSWNTGQAANAWNGGAPDPRAAGSDPRMAAAGGMGGPAPGGMFGGGGGSFLGTAAAAAVGVVGGSMLMNSLRGAFGGGSHGNVQSLGDSAGLGGDKSASPWGNTANSDLAKDAGVNDIGSQRGDEQRAGLFDDNRQDEGGYGRGGDGSYDTASHDDDYGHDDAFDYDDGDYA